MLRHQPNIVACVLNGAKPLSWAFEKNKSRNLVNFLMPFSWKGEKKFTLVIRKDQKNITYQNSILLLTYIRNHIVFEHF